MVICDEDKINYNNEYKGTPSLIIEVLSPSTRRIDQVLKLNLYMKSGIREYWIMDLEKKRVYQYFFSKDRNLENMEVFGADESITSQFFPDLEIFTKDIFGQVKEAN